MNELQLAPKPSWLIRLLNPFVAIPLTLVFLLLCAPFAYRGYKLSQVPDPGEPFDIEAFIKASDVDDADNALSDFKLAKSLLSSSIPPAEYHRFNDEIFTGRKLSVEAENFVKYLNRNDPALQAWKKGTEKPDFCEFPVDTVSYATLLSTAQDARDFVRLLNARAILEFRKGNYEDAANWYLTSFRTARLIQQNGGTIHHLVSYAIYNMAATNLIRQIQDQKIPEKVLKKLLQELTDLHNGFDPVSDAIKVEHLMFLDFTKSDYSGMVPGVGKGLPEFAPSSLFYIMGEPELAIKMSRQWLGNILPEVDRPRYQRSPFTSGSGVFQLYNPSSKLPVNRRQFSPAEFDEVWKQSRLFMFVSPSRGILDVEDKFQTRQRLLVAVLQLEIYRRQHGSYPLKLKDAFPDVKIQTDIFDPAGAPLRYARDADHVYRIWSVGPNEVDDAGTNIGFGHDNTDFGYQLEEKPKPANPE